MEPFAQVLTLPFPLCSLDFSDPSSLTGHLQRTVPPSLGRSGFVLGPWGRLLSGLCSEKPDPGLRLQWPSLGSLYLAPLRCSPVLSQDSPQPLPHLCGNRRPHKKQVFMPIIY